MSKLVFPKKRCRLKNGGVEMSEVEFSTQVFLPRLNALEDPLYETAKVFRRQMNTHYSQQTPSWLTDEPYTRFDHPSCLGRLFYVTNLQRTGMFYFMYTVTNETT